MASKCLLPGALSLSQGENIKKITNSFKLSVLKETESLSVREVGRKCNINEATIRGWKKNKDKLEGIGDRGWRK